MENNIDEVKCSYENDITTISYKIKEKGYFYCLNCNIKPKSIWIEDDMIFCPECGDEIIWKDL